MLFLPIDFC